jgi:phospholipase/carboxylesterase
LLRKLERISLLLESRSKKIEGVVVRDRIPPGDGPHSLILMLHGWTGDEQSMWVFASHLPKDAILVSPRGLYPAAIGGYGWIEGTEEEWPQVTVTDFRMAIDCLLALVSSYHYPSADPGVFSLIGFSQGAALSYAMALLAPARVHAVAGLAGFIPQGAETYIDSKPLSGKPVFVVHGTKDEVVPVSFARKSVSLLKKAGAQVSYCEAEVGHKLSSRCFSGLETFFT